MTDSTGYTPPDLPSTHLTPTQLKKREKAERRGASGSSRPARVEAERPRSQGASGSSRGLVEERGVSRGVLAALAVVAAALVAFAATGFTVDGLGIASWRVVEEQTDVESARRTAPATAERAAVAVLSYGHQTLEADRDNAARFMTPSYRKEYLDTFEMVLDNAPGLRAVVEAQVRASGVVHADPDRVNVLLFVNQTTTSTANEEPQTALNRVMMVMQRHGDDWLVDDITSY